MGAKKNCLFAALFLLAASSSSFANQWKGKQDFRTYSQAISRFDFLASTCIRSDLTETAIIESKTKLLSGWLLQLESEIQAAKQKHTPAPRDTRGSNSAQRDDWNKEDDAIKEGLEETVTSLVRNISGQRVSAVVRVCDVVKVDWSRGTPRPPEGATHLLVGRVRIISGLTPEARKRISELMASDRSTSDKIEIRKRIEDEDQFRRCAGVYVFGDEKLSRIRPGSNYPVEGFLRVISVYNGASFTQATEFEVEIKPEMRPATQPTAPADARNAR